MDPFEAFQSIDIRIGRISRVELNAEARKPAYKIWIDFGELGTKTTSAQYTALYKLQDLVGKQVACAVNLGSRKIAGFTSEVLMLGAEQGSGQVVYLTPERLVPLAAKVF